MEIETLFIDHFNDKIGQTFGIEEANTPALELKLVEAKALRNFGNAARAPFSLLFTTNGKDVLEQRMYALRHAVLGLQTIFLVPIGRDGDTVTYEAVFN